MKNSEELLISKEFFCEQEDTGSALNCPQRHADPEAKTRSVTCTPSDPGLQASKIEAQQRRPLQTGKSLVSPEPLLLSSSSSSPETANGKKRSKINPWGEVSGAETTFCPVKSLESLCPAETGTTLMRGPAGMVLGRQNPTNHHSAWIIDVGDLAPA
ncbi:uncharacterized protein PADG_06712 [Paracoccidioides brasiliensis Pb18]|uniref:Uncharacterized protein n=1 Tax=Paracoccidioides brasiliensis (strain Pb18) TaxID=502780 RepID=C1GHH6_PARBD|nr:uncharacterized protein PADG_06712 [Paracoccidioides brasiliensis Pb18]EEH50633.1 hypothetical protein PADG_06712 [Paracoccidioides brasiliensis Pb18]